MLTKETIKGMKKAELIALAIADQNRLEYLQDKVQKLDFENRKYKTGLEELNLATEMLIKNVAYEYGKDAGGRKEIWIPRVNQNLIRFDVETRLDKCRNMIGVILTEKKREVGDDSAVL